MYFNQKNTITALLGALILLVMVGEQVIPQTLKFDYSISLDSGDIDLEETDSEEEPEINFSNACYLAALISNTDGSEELLLRASFPLAPVLKKVIPPPDLKA